MNLRHNDEMRLVRYVVQASIMNNTKLWDSGTSTVHLSNAEDST